MRAVIVGISGPSLTEAEIHLLREHQPAGVILFARNVETPGQLTTLIAGLRDVLPANAVMMVDQEGGRVARLRPPHWRAHPPASRIGALHEADLTAGLRAAWLTGALIGLDCAAAGFDVVCAPVLDLSVPGAHDVIGDRAFSADPGAVGALGAQLAAGLLAAGIQPVMKHAPGHGRSCVDSHFGLPRIEAASLDDDVLPFMLNAGLPWAMTAHVLYPAWDMQRPATQSADIISTVIRHRIGFEGVLVTDDLAMQALTGSPADRALGALAAGCDVALYCSGELDPTVDLLAACPRLRPESAARLALARNMAAQARQFLDPAALATERDELLAT